MKEENEESVANNKNLLRKLSDHANQEQALTWEGSFSEYLDLIRVNPSIVGLAHSRMFKMITSQGVTELADGTKEYNFFKDDIYGLNRPLTYFVEEYLNPASRRLDIRKRILMFVGPVGGGKSTLATKLKRGLEEFSQTEAGAMYAIKGCPMHEEPLHLIPSQLRKDVNKEFGIHIEGELCPTCAWNLKHKWDNNIENVPIQRIAISERQRIGLGTFKPADPKSQDVAELTGSVNIQALTEYGLESDPRAYNFDGELNIANRGMMELIEMLKNEKRILYELNTVAGEQNIKVPRFALIYVDVAVVAHTNEFEYNSYFGNKENEAMIDRIFVVRIPYNLKLKEEIKIYEKLISESQLSDNKGDTTNIHIAPNALAVASTFSILTRLKDSRKAGLSTMNKLKLYDGEDQVGDWGQKNIKELQAEFQDEGMNGVSPRFVINRISSALVKNGKKCINPIEVLRSLKDGLQEYTTNEDDYKRYLNFIDETRRDYDDAAKKEVQRAFVYSYEESAKTLLHNYLDNVDAFTNRTKMKDPLTDEDVDADEQLMRGIEEQIGVSENAKREFREGIMRSVASVSRRGGSFDIDSDEKLKEALERKLFADLKDVVKITTSTKTPDGEQLKRVNEVVDRLVNNHGYCHVCANELLKYVGTLLNR